MSITITITTAIIPRNLGHLNYITSSLIFTSFQVVGNRAILSSWLTGSYCIVTRALYWFPLQLSCLTGFICKMRVVITHLKDVCRFSKISAQRPVLRYHYSGHIITLSSAIYLGFQNYLVPGTQTLLQGWNLIHFKARTPKRC